MASFGARPVSFPHLRDRRGEGVWVMTELAHNAQPVPYSKPAPCATNERAANVMMNVKETNDISIFANENN